MFPQQKKDRPVSINDLPRIKKSDLHPELKSFVLDIPPYSSYVCRLMVAYVVHKTGLPANCVTAEHILDENVEQFIISMKNKSGYKGIVSTARRIFRQLGNQDLLPDTRYLVCHPLLEEWIKRIPDTRKKPSKSHVMYFLSWCSAKHYLGTPSSSIPVWLLTRDALLDYRKYLLNRVAKNQISYTTASSYFACVIRWLNWLKAKGKIGNIETSKMGIKVSQSRERRVPTYPDIMKFLECLIDNEVFHPFLMYFLFLIGTGGRPIDLYNLKFNHVDLGSQTVRLQSKNGRERLLRVPDGLWELFLSRIKERSFSGQDYVFTLSDGKKLTYERLQKTFRRVLKVAGVPIDGMMAFRHRFATDCFEQDLDINLTLSLIGQENLSNLMRYQHTNRYQSHKILDKAYEAISWRNRLQ